MKVAALQHVWFETPGLIAQWAASRGHQFRVVRLWEDEPLPEISSLDMAVVMGGPMSVHDESRHGWMKPEKRFLERMLRSGKRVFGVCLGAQMLAEVMGGRVYRNPEKEIGWWPVRWLEAPAEQWRVFHWHGETFDVPPGAVRTAESGACHAQAFRAPGVLATQFHLEVTARIVEDLLRECQGDLTPAAYVQTAGAIRAGLGLVPAAGARLESLLDGFVSA